jgi:hypothetical protein
MPIPAYKGLASPSPSISMRRSNWSPLTAANRVQRWMREILATQRSADRDDRSECNERRMGTIRLSLD